MIIYGFLPGQRAETGFH
jgi:hypothetical protein